jgi:hypothetical protein
LRPTFAVLEPGWEDVWILGLEGNVGLNNGKLHKLSDVERTDDDPYCPITDMQRRLHHYKQYKKRYLKEDSYT